MRKQSCQPSVIGAKTRYSKLRKILLVDDDIHQHKLFECYAMKSQQNFVGFASDIEEALAQIKKQDWDLVLLDNRFVPFQDFTEPARLVRDAGYKNKIAVISADTDMLLFEDVERYTVDAVFNKSEFSLHGFDLIIESVF